MVRGGDGGRDSFVGAPGTTSSSTCFRRFLFPLLAAAAVTAATTSVDAASITTSSTNSSTSSSSSVEGKGEGFACRNDTDCQLNGICNTLTNVCHCDPAWTSYDCSKLHLLPAPRHVSFHGSDDSTTRTHSQEGRGSNNAGGGRSGSSSRPKTSGSTTSWGASIHPLPSSSSSSHHSTSTTYMNDNKDPDDRYVMYAAVMMKRCGLKWWRRNSAVVVGTSHNATGPYVERDIVSMPWAHNPQAIHIPPSPSDRGGEGVWAVYTLGDGIPLHRPPKDCHKKGDNEDNEDDEESVVMDLYTRGGHAMEATGRRRHLLQVNAEEEILGEIAWDGHGAERTRYHRVDEEQEDQDDAEQDQHYDDGKTEEEEDKKHDVQFTIHYSTLGPLGPFQTHVATIQNLPTSYRFPGNWNPSPVLLPDNRTVHIMVHTNPHNQPGWTGEVIVESRTGWKGPYQVVTSRDITSCRKCQEDPFLYIDHRGNYHVLYHKMFDNGSSHRSRSAIPSPGWTGGHSYSVDGIHWSPIVRCYNTSVIYEDGTKRELRRRERPKLIFERVGMDDIMMPTHLVNGVQDHIDGTYTLVVPLNTKH